MHFYCVPYSLYVQEQVNPNKWTTFSNGCLGFTEVSRRFAFQVGVRVSSSVQLGLPA